VTVDPHRGGPRGDTGAEGRCSGASPSGHHHPMPMLQFLQRSLCGVQDHQNGVGRQGTGGCRGGWGRGERKRKVAEGETTVKAMLASARMEKTESSV
jgi:hypothetical protein